MLNDEQINKILEGKLSKIGSLGGSIGGVISGGLGGGIGGGVGGAIGAKLSSRFLPTDYKNDSLMCRDQSKAVRLAKDYFGNKLIHESHKNDAYYLIGAKGSGFLNMNPCVLELIIGLDKIEITAHAKEGLIKQKTCVKAINKLKEHLLLTT